MSEVLDKIAVDYLETYPRSSEMEIGRMVCPTIFNSPPNVDNLARGTHLLRSHAEDLAIEFNSFVRNHDPELLKEYNLTKPRNISGQPIKLVSLPYSDPQERTDLDALPTYDSHEFGFILRASGGKNKPLWLSRTGINRLLTYDSVSGSRGHGRYINKNEYDSKCRKVAEELQTQTVVADFLRKIIIPIVEKS